MFTQTELEALGWTFDPADGEASKGGQLLVSVSSDFPLFALIRAANHLEGDDTLMDEPITPELIQQVSGETWVAPPPEPPPVATSVDADNTSAAIVSGNLAKAGLNVDQLASALQDLLAEAQAAIPYFEQYALDPSMTSQQWTAFQALDESTKDRLLYDTIRTLAALMRYLTGALT